MMPEGTFPLPLHLRQIALWAPLGLNWGFYSENPAANSLTYGTTLCGDGSKAKFVILFKMFLLSPSLSSSSSSSSSSAQQSCVHFVLRYFWNCLYVHLYKRTVKSNARHAKTSEPVSGMGDCELINETAERMVDLQQRVRINHDYIEG